MARLPVPGADDGTWGSILNSFLSQVHNADGTLKAGSVGSGQIQSGSIGASQLADGSIAETKLSAAVQSKLNTVGGGGSTDWATITNKPAVIAAGADQAAARAAIGAGTSNLTIGTTSATAKAGDYQPAAANISDATAIGRAILTAVDATAVKTSLSLTKTDVGLANVDNTSDATKNSAAATLTNKVINGSSNTITNISLTTGVTGTLPVANGGTGAATLTGYLKGSGTAAITAAATIPVSDLGTGRVVGSNNGVATNLTLWVGTQAQYDAIVSKDPNTVYAVTP